MSEFLQKGLKCFLTAFGDDLNPAIGKVAGEPVEPVPVC
jgi:hypothetical protein